MEDLVPIPNRQCFYRVYSMTLLLLSIYETDIHDIITTASDEPSVRYVIFLYSLVRFAALSLVARF